MCRQLCRLLWWLLFRPVKNGRSISSLARFFLYFKSKQYVTNTESIDKLRHQLTSAICPKLSPSWLGWAVTIICIEEEQHNFKENWQADGKEFLRHYMSRLVSVLVSNNWPLTFVSSFGVSVSYHLDVWSISLCNTVTESEPVRIWH